MRVETVPDDRPCSCGSALSGAILTDTSKAAPEDLDTLSPLLGRYLKD